MEPSPWGWYLPIVSPTTPAHLRCGRSGRSPMSAMACRILRCTGLRPSRTSGMARDVMTDSEYDRKDSPSSVDTGTSMTSRAKSPSKSWVWRGIRPFFQPVAG